MVRTATRYLQRIRRKLLTKYEAKLAAVAYASNALNEGTLNELEDQALKIFCSPDFETIKDISEYDAGKARSCQLFLKCKINSEKLSKDDRLWTIDSYKDVKPVAFLIRDAVEERSQSADLLHVAQESRNENETLGLDNSTHNKTAMMTNMEIEHQQDLHDAALKVELHEVKIVKPQLESLHVN